MKLRRLFSDFLNRTNIKKSLFWNVIAFSIQNFFKALDGILQVTEYPRGARKLLCHKERLAEKSLDFSRF